MECNWIIGISSTDEDGVKFFRFYGKEDEVKEKLMYLINEDRNKDAENWEYGCECKNDIKAEYNMYGYGCYNGYHIDYTAEKLDYVERI